jgi:hypothetical protein
MVALTMQISGNRVFWEEFLNLHPDKIRWKGVIMGHIRQS